MADPVVLFLVQEKTSYRSLQPVADALDEDCEVVTVLLTHIFDRTDQTIRFDESDIDYPTYLGMEYMTRFGLDGLPESRRQWLLQQVAVNRLSGVLYDADRLLDDVEPDLVIGTNDQVLFYRYLLERAAKRSIPTVVLQHGFFRYELGDSLFGQHWTQPTRSPDRPLVEKAKRRLLYEYGVTQFCNPYSSVVMGLGHQFTDRIAELRSEYPTNGRGRVVTTGTPEFDGDVTSYDPSCDSALFLSQQFLESFLPWDWEREKALVDRLCRIDEQLPVTVRPHPKDSRAKTEYVADRLRVSEDASLAADVAAHDVILGLDSTALIEGVVQGKLCGVFDVGYRDYWPLEHEHFFRVEGDGSDIDLAAAAEERSAATQRDWLDRFSYMPGEDPEAPESSTALAADVCRRLAADDGSAIDDVLHADRG